MAISGGRTCRFVRSIADMDVCPFVEDEIFLIEFGFQFPRQFLPDCRRRLAGAGCAGPRSDIPGQPAIVVGIPTVTSVVTARDDHFVAQYFPHDFVGDHHRREQLRM